MANKHTLRTSTGANTPHMVMLRSESSGVVPHTLVFHVSRLHLLIAYCAQAASGVSNAEYNEQAEDNTRVDLLNASIVDRRDKTMWETATWSNGSTPPLTLLHAFRSKLAQCIIRPKVVVLVLERPEMQSRRRKPRRAPRYDGLKSGCHGAYSTSDREMEEGE